MDAFFTIKYNKLMRNERSSKGNPTIPARSSYQVNYSESYPVSGPTAQSKNVSAGNRSYGI